MSGEKPAATRRWLTANSSDSARSMASCASAGSSYPMPAILPAAEIRFRRIALRSTIRAYCAAWTAVGVWLDSVPR